MTIRNQKGRVEDRIRVSRVLVSVYDKTGLGDLVNGIYDLNGDVLFLSTGGTYTKLQQVLGDDATLCLRDVGQYTGSPEMEGGLVKTLHPKIHAGILGERGNPEHEKYLHETLSTPGTIPADYFDMVVVNLYPFEQVVAKPETTFEQARGNIDIGGPTMVRAAAKNFMSCAVVINPKDYHAVLHTLRENNCCTTFDLRTRLMRKAFETTAEYDRQIVHYLQHNPNATNLDIKELYLPAERV